MYSLIIAGANQLLWYYADLEKQRCYRDQGKSSVASPNTSAVSTDLTPEVSNVTYGKDDIIVHDINHCLAWRRFAK